MLEIPTTMEEEVELFQNSEGDDRRMVYNNIVFKVIDRIKENDLKGIKKYVLVLEEISRLISEGTIETFHVCPRSPLHNKDLIAIACEHESVEVLSFMFENNGHFFRQIYGSEKNIPSMLPGEHNSRNCFYYAMRSNNLNLLTLLFNSFPSTYYIKSLQDFDEILGETYEELKTTNVPLMPQTEFTIERKITDLRFYNENPEEVRQIQFEKIEKRIVFLLTIIEKLQEHKNSDNVNEKILLILKHIVFNIHVLKRQLKISYDRLPWEEIEFSVIIFIYSHQKNDPNNIFYTTTMTKDKVMKHLENFGKRLKSLVGAFKKIPPKRLFQSVRNNREVVIRKIISEFPEFKQLYEDFQKLRDVYSLQQMNDAIILAAKARPHVGEEKLVIIKALQILGECLKNTLDSPKLSDYISELLIASAPNKTKELVTSLRDSLSHVDSLNKRLEIENNSDISFFLNLQDDMKKLGNVITQSLHNNKDKLLKELMTVVITDSSAATTQHIIKAGQGLKDTFFLPDKGFRTYEHETIEKSLQKLKNSVSDITDYEKNIFRKIEEIFTYDNMHNSSADINSSLKNPFKEYTCPIITENEKYSEFIMKLLKNEAGVALKSCQSPQKNLKSIILHLDKLVISFNLRHKNVESEEFSNYNYIFYNLLYLLQYEIGKIEWIEHFKQRLHENEKPKKATLEEQKETVVPPDYNVLLNSKLTQLQRFLGQKSFDFTIGENVVHYKENLVYQSVIEMIVLDILTLLGEIGKLLPDNVLTSLDDNTCLLNGRNLRNHLAHFNTYTEIFSSSPSGAIIINGLKFLADGINLDCKKKIGKVQKNDPEKVKQKFKREMDFVSLQMTMFDILEEENLDDLKACISRGADIFSRNIKLMTTVHCAAKGTDLDPIKFLVEKKVDVFLRDSDGCSAVHIAAMHGRGNIVEYLLSATQLEVNAVNNTGKTPLHMAAMYGQYEIVRILLQRNADKNITDIKKLLPLDYAIVNNCLEIVKLLLEDSEDAILTTLYLDVGPLHIAALHGHGDIVEFLIKKGFDVNIENENNVSPIHLAASAGHADVVKSLILHGAQFNEGSNSPLSHAIAFGNIDIVEIFLANGASPDICLSNTTSVSPPLLYAAEKGSAEIVTLLLYFKADVNAQDSTGKTALHTAAVNGTREIVEILIKNRAVVNIQDNVGSAPLHLASFYQHIEIVKLFIENNANVNIENFEKITPLHLAASQGNLDIVKVLHISGGNPNLSSVQGFTPLHFSLHHGHKDVSIFLIDMGANVKGSSNITPALHMAAMNGDEELTNMILDKQVNINEKDREMGLTALGFACIDGHKHIVEVLLNRGADINALDFHNQTLLLKAIINNHIEIVKLLIDKGAAVKGHADCCLTAIGAAIINNNQEIIEILIKNHSEVHRNDVGLAILRGNVNVVNLLLQNVSFDLKNSHMLSLAATQKNHTIVESLLSLDMDCNEISDHGKTPLMFAAESGNVNIVNHLLSHGADVNKVSDNGDTALHLAVKKGNKEVVNILMVNNTDSHKINKQGKMAIEIAITNNFPDIVKEILKIDVNILEKNYDEWNLLDAAVQSGNCEIVQLLLEFGADANKTNKAGWKPLHLAICSEKSEITRILLSHEKTLDGDDANLWFTLHYAVSKGNLEIVECVLNQKVHIDAQDPSGATPLHTAASRGDLLTFKFLLKHGACYNITNSANQKAIDIATNEEISQILFHIDNLFIAVLSDQDMNFSQVENLEDCCNAKDQFGNTLLHYTIKKKLHSLTHLLLNYKLNCNAMNNEGKTPLHYACENNDFNTIISLFSEGAIYNTPDNCSKRPIQYASHNDILDLFTIIEESFQYVKNKNVDVSSKISTLKELNLLKAVMNVRDDQGNTILITALKNYCPGIEKIKQHIFKYDSNRLSKVKELLKQELFTDAQSKLDIIIGERIKMVGKNHPWVWEVQKYEAKILFQETNYKDAIKLLKNIRKEQVKLFGLNNEQTLNTDSFIASILLEQGFYEEALNICQDTYSKQLPILGKRHNNTLRTLHTLAMAKDNLGMHDEALLSYVEIIDISKEINGESHSLTLAMQQNLAISLLKQNKTEAALSILKNVYNIYLKSVGPEHSATLLTLGNIASIYGQSNKLVLALKTYNHILKIQERILGCDHQDTILTNANIGSVYLTMGKYKEALKICTQAKQKLDPILGTNHSYTKLVQENIDTIHRKLQLDKQTVHTNVLNLISKGDINSLKIMVENKIDINYKDSEGRTLLYHAVYLNNVELTKFLLSHGAILTKVTDKGNTPLHSAVSKGYRELVQILLDHANLTMPEGVADFVNIGSHPGQTTALHVAAKLGYMDIVMLLLKHGAIYNCTDRSNNTPLFYSATREISEILTLIDDAFNEALIGNFSTIDEIKKTNLYDINSILNARNSRRETLKQFLNFPKQQNSCKLS